MYVSFTFIILKLCSSSTVHTVSQLTWIVNCSHFSLILNSLWIVWIVQCHGVEENKDFFTIAIVQIECKLQKIQIITPHFAFLVLNKNYIAGYIAESIWKINFTGVKWKLYFPAFFGILASLCSMYEWCSSFLYDWVCMSNSAPNR